MDDIIKRLDKIERKLSLLANEQDRMNDELHTIKKAEDQLNENLKAETIECDEYKQRIYGDLSFSKIQLTPNTRVLALLIAEFAAMKQTLAIQHSNLIKVLAYCNNTNIANINRTNPAKLTFYCKTCFSTIGIKWWQPNKDNTHSCVGCVVRLKQRNMSRNN